MSTAYVAVANPKTRARIVDDLRRQGWTVVEQPTGFHVLAALAEVIDGATDEVPAKIVVDAHARGCTGESIAAGLKALGVNVEVELVREPVGVLPRSSDLRVASAELR